MIKTFKGEDHFDKMMSKFPIFTNFKNRFDPLRKNQGVFILLRYSI